MAITGTRGRGLCVASRNTTLYWCLHSCGKTQLFSSICWAQLPVKDSFDNWYHTMPLRWFNVTCVTGWGCTFASCCKSSTWPWAEWVSLVSTRNHDNTVSDVRKTYWATLGTCTCMLLQNLSWGYLGCSLLLSCGWCANMSVRFYRTQGASLVHVWRMCFWDSFHLFCCGHFTLVMRPHYTIYLPLI